MLEKIKHFIVLILLLASVLMFSNGCASARYGQVPCPCENNGGR
jgi:hypothetical protein